MSRPRTLKIQGRRVKLVFKTPVDHPDYPGETFQGMWLGSNNTIELDTNLAPDELRATAVHEVLHDLEAVAGLELTEAQVSALGTIMFAFIRENPNFVAWLQERK